MAKWGMANVVEQSRGEKQGPVLAQVALQVFKLVEGQSRQVQHPQGVGEATGFRAVKGEERGTELADAPKPLERGCFDQIHSHRFGRILSIQTDGSMQGVVVGAAT
jgi:hypothetical protein